MRLDTRAKGNLRNLLPAGALCTFLLLSPLVTHGDAISYPADYHDAVVFYSDGDYASALHIFRRLARDGDSRAQVRLGTMYFFGKGVSPDYEEAHRWWLKAAEQGSADAQYLLAGLYAKGFGIPKDTEKALSWLNQAAEQDHVFSLLYLGQAYEHGLGSISPDGCAAAGWYRRAADLGDPLALLLMDNLLSHIAGKPCDSLRHSRQGSP
jgi:TPR repeat protein